MTKIVKPASPPAQWLFEDFAEGDKITTSARTISEADIVLTVGITGHSQPLFINEIFASTTPYGTRIAPLELSIGVMAGLLTRTGILENQIGLLEFHCKAPAAVRAGDTVHAITQIEKTRLTSDKDRGIVTFHDCLLNQAGETVLDARRVAMFWTRNR